MVRGSVVPGGGAGLAGGARAAVVAAIQENGFAVSFVEK